MGARDEAVADRLQAAFGAVSAAVADNIAGFLARATEFEPPTQNPKQAIQLAKKAVSLAPQNGSYWTTLGAAYYRAGQWHDALAALEKAMQLRSGGDSRDWFCLAMVQRQLGDPEKARHWYDQAVQWLEQNKPRAAELDRMRVDAATLLGIQQEPLQK